MIELVLELQEFILEVDSAVVVNGRGIPYTGEYEVDPDFEGKTLETKNKTLSEDITVNPIEVSRVSNPAGGKTIYIGGNVNG